MPQPMPQQPSISSCLPTPSSQPTSTKQSLGSSASSNPRNHCLPKQAQPQQEPPRVWKKRRQWNSKTPHGSYKGYYNRRHDGLQSDSDDRLPLIRKVLEGRQGAVVLDVGCNDGALTVQVAMGNAVKRLVGIDINPELITKGRRYIQKKVKNENKEREKQASSNMDEFVPLSCQVVQGRRCEENKGHNGSGGGVGKEKQNKYIGFPYNLSYRCEDFVADVPGKSAKEKEVYDVILCLSITKWVHMHTGDDGLKRMFSRMYDCLKPGGVMILEPQPIKSYKRARQKKLEGFQKTFRDDLKLKPAMFKAYLLDNVGFKRFEMLRDVRTGKSFNRPVMAFYKQSVESQKKTKFLERKEATTIAEKIIGQVLNEAMGGTSMEASQCVEQILDDVFQQAMGGKSRSETRRGTKRRRAKHASEVGNAQAETAVQKRRKGSNFQSQSKESHDCVSDAVASTDDAWNTGAYNASARKGEVGDGVNIELKDAGQSAGDMALTGERSENVEVVVQKEKPVVERGSVQGAVNTESGQARKGKVNGVVCKAVVEPPKKALELEQDANESFTAGTRKEDWEGRMELVKEQETERVTCKKEEKIVVTVKVELLL